MFLSDLDVRVLPPSAWASVGGKKWELLAPLRFLSRRFSGVFVAPVGFRTDYASIPRGLWNVYPKDGPWLRAAVIHDAGYARQLVTEHGTPINLIKPYVDELFGEAMRADGVPAHRAALFVAMVDLFGHGAPDLVRPQEAPLCPAETV